MKIGTALLWVYSLLLTLLTGLIANSSYTPVAVLSAIFLAVFTGMAIGSQLNDCEFLAQCFESALNEDIRIVVKPWGLRVYAATPGLAKLELTLRSRFDEDETPPLVLKGSKNVLATRQSIAEHLTIDSAN